MTEPVAPLPPDPSETARIARHFEALSAWNADLDALLRTAVALAGCGAGVVTRVGGVRLDSRGIPATNGAVGASSVREVPGSGRVWLERDEGALPGDVFLLMCLADAVGVAVARTTRAQEDRPPLGILLDPYTPREDRAGAAARLRLAGVPRARVLASAPSGGSTARAVAVPTLAGTLMAALDDGGPGPGPRVGIGVWTDPLELPASWRSATIALRITSDLRPRVDATELGPLLRLLELADADPDPSPEVEAIGRLLTDSRDAELSLDALVATESTRAAAAAAGVHHSTMQRRVAEFTDLLGYDPVSPDGRVRVALALHLHRLATTRFG